MSTSKMKRFFFQTLSHINKIIAALRVLLAGFLHKPTTTLLLRERFLKLKTGGR